MEKLILICIIVFMCCGMSKPQYPANYALYRGECVHCRGSYGSNKTEQLTFNRGYNNLQEMLNTVQSRMFDASNRLDLQSDYNCCKISFSQYHYKRDVLIEMLETALKEAKRLPVYDKETAHDPQDTKL